MVSYLVSDNNGCETSRVSGFGYLAHETNANMLPIDTA